MALVFCNGYPRQVWVAIMFYNPEDCGGEGGDFEMMGWWNIAPGACTTVYANDLADLNALWYYFAEADDGIVWAGPFEATVPTESPFGGGNSCYGLGQVTSDGDFRSIGFREFNIDSNDDYTLTLVP